ncbi:MAG: hypothetical protein Q9159_006063 [Coniocarpon cinnabarinum]
MYKTAALLSLASFAFGAPAPQGTTLCNPIALPFPDTQFQLAAYNPVTQSVTGLAITEVSRGAKILVASLSGGLADASSFTYEADSQHICATGFGCDDDSLNNPLLFGSPAPEPVPVSGGVTLKAGDGCFHTPNQQPLFVVGGACGDGAGTSAANDWAGWVFCGRTKGIYWNGGAPPDAGCEEVSLQVFNLPA